MKSWILEGGDEIILLSETKAEQDFIRQIWLRGVRAEAYARVGGSVTLVLNPLQEEKEVSHEN